MLNIKEVHGLPDLHASHPAFRCRSSKKKNHSRPVVHYLDQEYINSVLKMHCFEDLRTCCCYLNVQQLYPILDHVQELMFM